MLRLQQVNIAISEEKNEQERERQQQAQLKKKILKMLGLKQEKELKRYLSSKLMI